MILPLILRPEADSDIRQAFYKLERIRFSLGRRFTDQLRVVLERIELMPELAGFIWRDVRAVRVKSFHTMSITWFLKIGSR
jgi:hypothetical protein